jgi:hypothetical protein
MVALAAANGGEGPRVQHNAHWDVMSNEKYEKYEK